MGTMQIIRQIRCSRREQPIARPVVPPIILTQQKFIDMKKVFLMAAILAVSGLMAEVSAQTTGETDSGNGNSYDIFHHKPHKCPKPSKTPQVSYNSSSTVLNVSFPTNGQGGKVEIYRNGIKVVNTTAPAGTSLCYMLRNLGKGEFKIIVSQGNTVVYYGNYVVK